MLLRLFEEPPFRLIPKVAMRYLPRSFPPGFATRVRWEALVPRPEYALGTLFAATEAKLADLGAICVLEFGVAQGNGLLILQDYATAIEREVGVKVFVFGFDLGSGLPNIRDYRDHPDIWRKGQFAMNDQLNLREKLRSNTQLILGDVRDTVPEFVAKQPAPIGFVAFDVDLYSSTRSALQVFTVPGSNVLPHTALYFDDISLKYNHRFAGELLAIEDFNRESPSVKIDHWRGLREQLVFRDSPWLEHMFMAHVLGSSVHHSILECDDSVSQQASKARQ